MRDPVTVTSSTPSSCANTSLAGATASADATMIPLEAERRLDLIPWRCHRRPADSVCSGSAMADDSALTSGRARCLAWFIFAPRLVRLSYSKEGSNPKCAETDDTL